MTADLIELCVSALHGYDNVLDLVRTSLSRVPNTGCATDLG
jgi:hypothetical protein